MFTQEHDNIDIDFSNRVYNAHTSKPSASGNSYVSSSIEHITASNHTFTTSSIQATMRLLSNLNPFSKKETEEERTIRLAAEDNNEALKHEKKKAEIMKYRGYTDEQAEAHLAQKKDGMNSERGLRALGTALAPQRLST
jgi:hypothetical protein